MGAFVFIALINGVMGGEREVPRDSDGRYILNRQTYGQGRKEVDLEARIGGEKENIHIRLEEQQYSDKDAEKALEKSVQTLEKLMLGDNKSADEVKKDLNLIRTIPDTGITVSWDIQETDILSFSGKIVAEDLPEEGKVTMVKAVLSAKDIELEHLMYLRILPPAHDGEEQNKIILEKEIRNSEEKNREMSTLALPDSLGDEKIHWYYPKNSRTLGLLLTGVVLAGGIWISEKHKEESLKEVKKRQMTADYPQIISQLALFLKSGMTLRLAWFRVAKEYEKNRYAKKKRPAYEEMIYTMHQIEQGVSESECYEQFGNRCGLVCYRKFGTLLSQNLKKGSKGLTDILKRESADAFEARKNLARKLGEEAGTKLLGPMFMLLVMIILIIIVPAFLSIQI